MTAEEAFVCEGRWKHRRNESETPDEVASCESLEAAAFAFLSPETRQAVPLGITHCALDCQHLETDVQCRSACTHGETDDLVDDEP